MLFVYYLQHVIPNILNNLLQLSMHRIMKVLLSNLSSSNQKLAEINQEIDFWQTRITAGNHNHLYYNKVATQLSKRFKINGNPKDLIKSDSLLIIADSIAQHQHISSLHNLTYNAISQHQFNRAKKYGSLADKLGYKKFITQLMLTDIHQELGNLNIAQSYLHKTGGKKNFDYLVRKSKLTDARGSLDSAVIYMENAIKQISSKSNPELYWWAKSNLGDMYGHQGKVKQAYQAYLEVLNYDPHQYHAWKGIAWIAFSHDKNISEARRIIQHIQKNTFMPDLFLFLSEIAEFENKPGLQANYIQHFNHKTTETDCEGMYLRDLAKIEAEYFQNFVKAQQIIEQEIQNRPNAQSYALKAWLLHKEGKNKKQ